MHTSGIDVILSDDHDEAVRIAEGLGMTPVPFSELMERILENGVVFIVVHEDPYRLKKLSEKLNIRRGIISTNGKLNSLNFNKDWMKFMLEYGKPKPISEKPKLTEIVIPVEHEKDDPYESLGYARR